jgi:hypothetical protein
MDYPVLGPISFLESKLRDVWIVNNVARDMATRAKVVCRLNTFSMIQHVTLVHPSVDQMIVTSERAASFRRAPFWAAYARSAIIAFFTPIASLDTKAPSGIWCSSPTKRSSALGLKGARARLSDLAPSFCRALKSCLGDPSAPDRSSYGTLSKARRYLEIQLEPGVQPARLHVGAS